MAGLWFEEFEDGMVFNQEWSRTITEADNVWFSLLTMNPQPLHIDAHYAAKSEWGKPLVNSLFTLGLTIGDDRRPVSQAAVPRRYRQGSHHGEVEAAE
jgi:acyl dehydratase